MSARFGVQLNVPVGVMVLLFTIVKFPAGIPLFQLILTTEFPEPGSIHEVPPLTEKELEPNEPNVNPPDVVPDKVLFPVIEYVPPFQPSPKESYILNISGPAGTQTVVEYVL